MERHDEDPHDHRPAAPGFRPPAQTDADQTADATGVHRRIVLDAPPSQVWRALTDPEELAAWWGEGSELDATPDGTGRLVEDGEPVRLARVVEVRPGRRLVFEWWPEDPDVDEPASRVTIELVPCPTGTVVTIVERALLDLSLLPVLVAPHPSFLPSPWVPRSGGRALARV
jgi:uncharacterized protein YndB with AHSA1/START domain